jgi:parvulin-like peptidyl-prolyl isomerase
MAIIGKIREKNVLVLILVGLALVAFIVGSYFNGGGEQIQRDSTIGTVNGVGMNESLYSDYENNAKQNIARRKYDQAKTDEERSKVRLTEQDEEQAAREAFNFLSQKMLMDAECAKLGITVTDEEVEAHMYGNDELPVHSMIADEPGFKDSLGQFDANRFEQFINPEDEQNIAYAKNFENSFRETLVREKYLKIISQGAYVTKLEAKHAYVADNGKRSIRIVGKKFSDLTKDIELTEEQLKAYYEEHKSDISYKQKDGVILKYASINIEPSAVDFDRAKAELNEKRNAFKASTNDSLFAMTETMSEGGARLFNTKLSYSATPRFGSYSDADFDQVQAAQVGDVVGPIEMTGPQGAEFILAKVQSVEVQKQAWVRHILVTAVEGDEDYAAKKSFSDSLLNVLRADKSKFNGFVKTYSEDPGSVANNGEYKWFPEGQMVPTFNDFSFQGAIGEMKVVTTTYGFHIVEVLGRRDVNAPTVIAISNGVTTSDASIVEAEKKAYELKDKLFADPTNFDTIATKEGMSPRTQTIYIETAKAPVFGNVESQVLNFAMNKGTKTNDVSRPLNNGKQLFVIMLSKKLEKGIPAFDDVKQRMTFKAKNDVVAEQLKKEMAGFSNLEELAGKMGLEIKAADVTLKNTNINGVGNEPAVVGALFSNLDKGTITKPLAGNSGVYVVEIVNVTEVAETSDYSKQLDELKKANGLDGVYGGVMGGLQDKYEPIDNRLRIRYGAK